MRKTIGIIGVFILVIGGIYLASGRATAPKPTASTPSATVNPGSQPIVRFNGTEFSPATFTMKAGTSITFLNTSTTPLAVDSDPHPSHTDNPELNLGDIAAGTSKNVTLTKVGDWGYHDHLNPSVTGRLTVQ